MVQAHGQGLGRKQQHTGAKSFGLTATNDQRGSINVHIRGWWYLFTAMQSSNDIVQPLN
jgi:hypothetical protein